MKMGEVQATHMTMFTVIAEVVSVAFGGKQSESPSQGPITEDLTKLDSTAYVQRVNQLFSGGI
jgi:hypothetical protein